MGWNRVKELIPFGSKLPPEFVSSAKVKQLLVLITDPYCPNLDAIIKK